MKASGVGGCVGACGRGQEQERETTRAGDLALEGKWGGGMARGRGSCSSFLVSWFLVSGASGVVSCSCLSTSSAPWLVSYLPAAEVSCLCACVCVCVCAW